MVQAAVYCRISLAKYGDTESVDDQKGVNLKLAASKGWAVTPEHVYVDNSKSAWKANRRRPGWDAMLEAVGRGEIDAIVVYHGDRLIRQPWDLELLIRLAQGGLLLASPTGERDFGKDDDLMVMRIEAAMACREVANTSRRQRSKYDRLAEKGIARSGGRGGRAYGYEPDGVTVRDEEADIIREVADRIIAGEPVGGIVRALNDRGLRHVTGNEFAHHALKLLMMRPRLAGLMSHHGTIVGDAAWPKILDRDVWEAVCAVLENRATRYPVPTNARRHLLTGLAVCGSCEQAVAIRHKSGGASLAYGCVNPACPRKLQRAVRYLDPFVEGATVEFLNDDAFRARHRPRESAHLAVELARLEGRRQKILEDFGGDENPDSADVIRVSLGENRKKIDEVRRRIAESQAGHVLDGLWGIDLVRWRALRLPRQRAAINALMEVRLLPARAGRGFDPATVRLDQR